MLHWAWGRPSEIVCSRQNGHELVNDPELDGAGLADSVLAWRVVRSSLFGRCSARLGLFLGAAFIVGTTALDQTIRSAEEVELLLGLPCFAAVPRERGLAKMRLNAAHRTAQAPPITMPPATSVSTSVPTTGNSEQAIMRRAHRAGGSATTQPPRLHVESGEAYRKLFASLKIAEGQGAKVIGVTSAVGGEGRTTTSLGLAETLNLDLDVPVTLVELDLRQPVLAAYFGFAGAPGIGEVLRGECDIVDALKPVSDTYSVIPAGTIRADSPYLYRRVANLDIFHGPALPCGITILDLPPIMGTSYLPLVAETLDALVLVVRAGVTPARVVRSALARLPAHPQAGVVLTACRGAAST